MARCTFFEGRYFLGHPNTPRPISKDAGTVPAHFDLGFIGQLSKLTFRPTVNVQLGYVAKISKIVLDYMSTGRCTAAEIADLAPLGNVHFKRGA